MTWQDKHQVVPAVYLIVRKDKKILCARRANTGYGDGLYSLPSGHVEARESAVMAVIREAKEEIGITIDPADLAFVHVAYRFAEERDHERVDFYFEVTKWSDELHNAEPEKCDDIQWFAEDALPGNMIPAVRQALLTITNNGQTYSDFGFEA